MLRVLTKLNETRPSYVSLGHKGAVSDCQGESAKVKCGRSLPLDEAWGRDIMWYPCFGQNMFD